MAWSSALRASVVAVERRRHRRRLEGRPPGWRGSRRRPSPPARLARSDSSCLRTPVPYRRAGSRIYVKMPGLVPGRQHHRPMRVYPVDLHGPGGRPSHRESMFSRKRTTDARAGGALWPGSRSFEGFAQGSAGPPSWWTTLAAREPGAVLTEQSRPGSGASSIRVGQANVYFRRRAHRHPRAGFRWWGDNATRKHLPRIATDGGRDSRCTARPRHLTLAGHSSKVPEDQPAG